MNDKQKNKSLSRKRPRRSTARSLSMKKWKIILKMYMQCDGNAKLTYTSLPKKTVSWPTLLKYVFEGDDGRNLPPFHSVYKESLQKAVIDLRADLTDRLKDTLTLGEAYKVALARKIRDLENSPDKVTPKIGTELLALAKIEQGFMKILQEDHQKANLDEQPLEVAIVEAEAARKSLARVAKRLESEDEPSTVKFKFDEPIGGYQNVVPMKKRLKE